MDYFCSETIEIWSLVGTVVTILKIAIPLIIIVLAIIDLGKAAISSKDDEVSKAFKTLLRRIIAGVVIFFIPTLVNLAFGLIDNFSEENGDYNICSACVAGGSCTVADGFCSSEDGKDTTQCETDSKYYNSK